MSSDCVVTFHDSPPDLEAQVLKILASHGYDCEFAPGTVLLDPSQGGFLLRVRAYPSPKPRVRPDRSFLISVGLDNVPDEARPTHRRLNVSTSSGRTRLDSDLQFLVAAAIAQLARGQFYDPQQDALLGAEAAVDYAFQKAQRGAPPHDLREREFTGWPAGA